MKKGLLILLTIFMMVSLTKVAKASHVIGGDILIEWVSQNNYRLTLRFYRDDANSTFPMPGTMTVNVYDQVTKAQVASQVLTQTSITLVPLGDPCYTPDPNDVQIQEGIYESTTDFFIPDNASGNGYYLSATESARNALAINVPTFGTMVWLAMMPNPALGQNSSPDFGNYPADAYFCINSPKIIQYPVTDADGDSLAYSFTEPLDAGSLPSYPYYPSLGWQAPYSITDIIGGTTAMSIDATTGVIIANPSVTGFFTFAVRVEEFRDTTAAGNGPKVKIGETRRDIQYESQPCTSGSPPFFTDPTLSSTPPYTTVQIPYNKLYCRDFVMEDINTSDSIYMEMVSTVFDSGAFQINKVPDINGNLTFYTNWDGTTFLDTTITDTNYYDPILQLEFNEGAIGQGFCWTPNCNQVGQTFDFYVNVSSAGCDGLFTDTLLFYLEIVPPVAFLDFVGPKSIPFGSEYCKSIIFEDTSIVDMLDIVITSDLFLEGAEIPDVGSSYTYSSFEHANSVVTGVPNDAQSSGILATQFCWTPDCENIGLSYSVRAVLSSVDCPTAFKPDTMEFDILVTPPFDSLDVLPNVITPNGDGVNDFYSFGWVDDSGVRHGGTSNPCNDNITIEIFNRWGNSVFKSEENEFRWEGTNKGGGDVPAGTYFVLVTGIYGSEIITLDQRTVTVLR